jgi:hypothetical protein
MEMHDEVIWAVDDSADIEKVCKEVKEILDNLPYKAAWNWEPTYQFTWSVGYGKNWGEVTDV